MSDTDLGFTDAMFFEQLSGHRVRCDVCPHRCVIHPDQAGLCGVRVNANGGLYLNTSARGIISHVDAIEKKPFYHFLPASACYSVGAFGCNMRCQYCINWELSQPAAPGVRVDPLPCRPAEAVLSRATASGCRSIAYTYTEPAVFFEYVLETAKLARAAGFANVIKTNGLITPEALAVLVPYIDAANVDLKAFRDRTYRHLGGQLQPVLTTLRELKAWGIWTEVTTLVVPGQNDDDGELADMARFIADELGPDTPWHLLRFFPNYKMSDGTPTPMHTLERALNIGKTAGLNFAYLSNLLASGKQDTHCPSCGSIAVSRTGANSLTSHVGDGRCVHCQGDIPGIWTLDC